MNKEMIHQIATQIVNEQIIDNWIFYAVLMALSFVTSAFSTFLASYFKERGKNFATSADIDLLMRKLEDTTTLTETIKAEISDDFGYKSKCRDKIEDLFQSIYEFEEWHPTQTNKIINGELSQSSAPKSKIEMLISIYFPKCIEQIDLLRDCDTQIVAFNLQMEAKIKTFDGMEFINCMLPVKSYCQQLRKSLLENYEIELRLQ